MTEQSSIYQGSLKTSHVLLVRTEFLLSVMKPVGKDLSLDVFMKAAQLERL